MEKIIEIDGKKIPFKATAGTVRRYRSAFGRDLMLDMKKLVTEYQKGENMDKLSLEIFENVAFVMAKHADDTIANNPDEWLDGFNMFSIWEVLPQIIELWQVQQMPLNELKKK